MTEIEKLDLLIFCLGIFNIGLGIPLIMGIIGPNKWYGYRTKKTLSDPAIWYPINKVCGIDLAISGFIISVVSLILYSYYEKLHSDTAALIEISVVIVSVVAMVVHTSLKLRKM